MTQYAVVSNYPYGTYGNGSRCITSFGSEGDRRDDLNWPWYCDINNQGDIVIADTENNRIQVYQPTTFRTSINPYHGSNDHALLNVRSVKKSSIPGTNLIAVNTGRKQVCLLYADYNTGIVRHVHSFGQGFFHEPIDAAVDSRNGNIVVVDTGYHRVSIHNQVGDLLAFCEQPHFEMARPSAVSISRVGDIFVSDTGNNCIRQFTCNGQYKATIGCKGSAVGQFNSPRGIAFDHRGYMYVADELNNRVQMISADLTHFTNAVTNLPLPKGVAASKHLIVTAADNFGFAKVYYS